MKSLPWFRAYTEMVDDEKLGLLAFEDRWHFVALLCLKASGLLEREKNPAMLRRKVALKLQLSLDDLDAAIARMASAGVVDAVTYQPMTMGEPERPMAHVWRAIRERIFARDNYTCQYCGERGKKLECDHIHPVAKGGTHEDENLTTACFSCNRSKRDKLVSEWRPS